MEEWRLIPGHLNYEVSNLGRVKSLARLDARGRRRSEKYMSLITQKSGHKTVALYTDGVRTTPGVHRLVLAAFVGPCPEGLEACHWNDIPDDNRLENLRWDTRAANIADSVRNGTHHMARKTHCPSGHAYASGNTYMYPQGNRACNECRRNYREQHKEERRAKGREYMRLKRAEQPPAEPQTHCKRGHAFDEANTRIDSKGGRVCLTCKRMKAREHYEKNRSLYIEKARTWKESNTDRARELSREGQRRYRAKKKAV